MFVTTFLLLGIVVPAGVTSGMIRYEVNHVIAIIAGTALSIVLTLFVTGVDVGVSEMWSREEWIKVLGIYTGAVGWLSVAVALLLGLAGGWLAVGFVKSRQV